MVDQEVAAFLATRRMIGAHAKAIAANVTPTNLELVRAITELRTAAEAGTLTPVIAHAPEILIGLDDAIAHLRVARQVTSASTAALCCLLD